MGKWKFMAAFVAAAVLIIPLSAAPGIGGKAGEVWRVEAAAPAADGFVIDGNGVLTKYTGTAKEVTVPDGVTAIGRSAFEDCKDITSVRLPSGVESIGGRAFMACESLEQVTLPDGLARIGEFAFWGCEGLIHISLPESVTHIGDQAFYLCENLESVNIPSGVTRIGGMTFYKCSNLTEIGIPSGVTEIREKAFDGCIGLREIDIPSSVKWIDAEAFHECSNLVNVNFSEGLQSIGKYAFEGCENIVSIRIPSSVESIGNSAFYGCLEMGSLELPEGVASIGKNAFYKCEALTSVSVPASLTMIEEGLFGGCISLEHVAIANGPSSIGKGAFSGCEKLTRVNIPASVAEIKDYAFSFCGGITDISLPNGVITIGGSAFYGCSGLVVVEIPASVQQIGDEAFCSSPAVVKVAPENPNYASEEGILYDKPKTELIHCGDKRDVDIPEGVKRIKDKAFYGCKGMRTVSIPKGLEEIGNEAFYYCTLLTHVDIPEGVASIGESAFRFCEGLKDVSLPASLRTIGTYAFVSTQASFQVAEANQVFSSEAGALYHKGNTELVSYMAPGALVLPDTVTAILDYACYENGGLLSITIPSSVASIGKSAFASCSGLTNVKLPEGVKSIGEGAFSYCKNMKRVTIPQSVEAIADNSFYQDVFQKYGLEVILGKLGSYAESYARRRGFRFCDYSLAANGYRIALETQSVAYNGTERKPQAVVSYNGYLLENGTDYTVTYKDNIKIGTAKAVITGKGDFTGTVTKTFQIVSNGQTPGKDEPSKDNPGEKPSSKKQTISCVKTYQREYRPTTFNLNASVKPAKGGGALSYKSSDKKVVTVSSKGKVTVKGTGVAIITVTAKKTSQYNAATAKITVKIRPVKQKTPTVKAQKGKKLKIGWKMDKRASGYQLQYSTDRKFKNKATVAKNITKNKTISVTIKKLKAGKKYYVRLRSYKNAKLNGKNTKVYSDWSMIYGIKVKK